MTYYRDMGDDSEDDRIKEIGHYVMEHRKIVAFITDSDEGKAERYIKKLQDRFPSIRIIKKFPGPVPDTICVKVGPPVD